MAENGTNPELVELTAHLVSAYVSNNPVPRSDLSNLVQLVHGALRQAATGPAEEPAPALVPAVPVKKSITPDFIVCLEDGKKFKSLRRHLNTRYGMTPEQYRAKWSLPADYPMVAPNYAAARSQLAKALGLGRKPKIEVAPPPAPAKRSRKKAAAAA